jgi:sugar phosphate isomerase/epimerase
MSGTVRIGLDEWSIRHLDIPAVDKLALVERLGFEGIQFLNAGRLSPTLDLGEIREVSAEARRRGLYLEVGVPGLNALRPPADALAAGAGDLLEGLKTFLRAAAATGCSAIRTYVGSPGDRGAGVTRWAAQVGAATELTRALGPLARDLGVRLAFETHADATTHELLRLIDEAGDDVAAICLDTGNLPVALEEPMAGTRRAASHVVCTHLKDCVVFQTESGLGAQSRPWGTGIVPLREVLETLRQETALTQITIEDHDGVFEAPLFGAGAIDLYPDADPAEIVALLAAARACERRFADGEAASPDAIDATPWGEQAEDRLRAGGVHVRKLVDEDYGAAA